MSGKQTRKFKLESKQFVDVWGFKMSDLEKELSPEVFLKLKIYLNGQTVGIYESEDIVYEVDFIRFMKGLPALD